MYDTKAFDTIFTVIDGTPPKTKVKERILVKPFRNRPGFYDVVNADKNTRYEVQVATVGEQTIGRCTCTGYSEFGAVCKHIRSAVNLYEQEYEINKEYGSR